VQASTLSSAVLVTLGGDAVFRSMFAATGEPLLDWPAADGQGILTSLGATDGMLVAAGGPVGVFDPFDGELFARLAGSEEIEALGMAWHERTPYCVGALPGGELRCWHAVTGELLRTVAAGVPGVSGLIVESVEDRFLAVLTTGTELAVVDLLSGEGVARWAYPAERIGWLDAAGHPAALVAQGGGALQVWDGATGAPILGRVRTPPAACCTAGWVEASPDPVLLALLGEGRRLHVLRIEDGVEPYAIEFGDEIRTVHLDDERLVVVGTAAGAVALRLDPRRLTGGGRGGDPAPVHRLGPPRHRTGDPDAPMVAPPEPVHRATPDPAPLRAGW
jgi:hypothetical protein